MSFVHLHTHTQYSLLDGSNKISEYVKRVKEMGMNAAAITDHGVMYGVIEFYKAAKANGINPILGCEVYVAPGSRFDREAGKGEDRYYHLILLAENNTGYYNLMQIVSIGFVDGYYYRPRVDFETIEKYHEGLICLSACLAGEVSRHLMRADYREAKEVALKYEKCFGKGNYFLEMQDHGIPQQRNVNAFLIELSKETGIPLVATNDCHYTYAEDAGPHDVLLCLQTGKLLKDEDRMRYDGGQYYVKSEEEMRSLFAATPEAISNTQQIADRCHVELEFGNTKLPHFNVPDGYNSREYLKKLCDEGLIRRYKREYEENKEAWKSLINQLYYELDVIETMGYTDYFLIVWDFINYARTHDIPVGPGRGSAAGSLVAYTTGITNIDPIKYQLLFERFLNPERVSMPDVDVDFCYERRQEVIDYVIGKYGKDSVSQIVTFGTLAARGVIRDVGRVMDLPYNYVSDIAKSVPRELGITLEKALKMNPELRKQYETDENVKLLIDTAMRLEGLPRHTSTHAAGVVITQEPIGEYVPVARAQDGSIVTQFTMTTIEELGLLKMDFLGLRTLTIIKDCLRMIEKGGGPSINPDEIDYNDSSVYELISAGQTDGIFQLESDGMKNFMKELKPENLEDIIAGVALYRPGPMDFIPAYIKGKRDKDAITYECPELEPILSATYGCIVYQEQVMQIVRSLAGYSMGRSDILRRAMSKKKGDVMEKERRNFVYGNEEEGVPGCIANGIPENVANHIYDEMIDFAKYAFNKSHAASYAVVAYQTAYLKKYYPREFMAAMLTAVADDNTKVTKYVLTCREMGIEVLPPDINYGEGAFSVDDGRIRYGMYAIKSLGHPVTDAIVSERLNGGAYTSLQNFLERIMNINEVSVNKRAIEALIKAGALDGMDGNRRQKVMVFPNIIDDAQRAGKNNLSGQISFADLIGAKEEDNIFKTKMPPVEEYEKEELLAFEKEVMGVYVSGHPLEDYDEILKKYVTATADKFAFSDNEEDSADLEINDSQLTDNQRVIVGGIINQITIKYTKKGDAMAFITIEDLQGTIEVVVFPNTYERCKSALNEGEKVLVKGRVNLEADKDAKLISESIIPFYEIPGHLWIRFKDMSEYEAKSEELNAIILENPGKEIVSVFINESRVKKNMERRIRITPMLKESLFDIFGEDNVKVTVEKLNF